MLNKKLLSSSKTKIGKNSNGNTVLQNSIINNPVIYTDSNIGLINVMSKSGKYDEIQKLITSQLSFIRTTHPLFPNFSVKVDEKLNRLVSTPETKEAFLKYPKKVKSILNIDYEKYPYMDKSETPWEYAYRTQTKVLLEAESYKEYLGDVEDPFPVMTYTEGMVTEIEAPEFPKAVKTNLVSGDIAIPVLLRRIPCLEYGKVVFENISHGHGFDFRIILSNFKTKTTFTITKTESSDLTSQLLREKLINNISTTKKISIVVDDGPLMDATMNESDLKAEIFEHAPYLTKYIESLLTIERIIGCRFNHKIQEISDIEYRTAIIMSLSLEGKWYFTKPSFDNEIRCDYDHIPDEILKNPNITKGLCADMKVLSISLQGLKFFAEKCSIVYTDAVINNVESIKKNIMRKKKNILITVKPQTGKNVFNKLVRFEGIKPLS